MTFPSTFPPISKSESISSLHLTPPWSASVCSEPRLRLREGVEAATTSLGKIGAMIRKFQFSLRALLIAMLAAGAAFGWLVWPIECPVCHGDNVDAEGRCRLGDRCPYYGDWECWWRDSSAPDLESVTGVPGHRLMNHCHLCGRDGRIRRLDLIQYNRGKPEPLSKPLKQ